MYVLYEHFRHSHLVINLDKKYIKIQHAEGEICVNSRILQRHHAMMLFKCKWRNEVSGARHSPPNSSLSLFPKNYSKQLHCASFSKSGSWNYSFIAHRMCVCVPRKHKIMSAIFYHRHVLTSCFPLLIFKWFSTLTHRHCFFFQEIKFNLCKEEFSAFFVMSMNANLDNGIGKLSCWEFFCCF